MSLQSGSVEFFLYFFLHRMHRWKDRELALRLWVSRLPLPLFFICVCDVKAEMSMETASFRSGKSVKPCVPGRSCGLLATAFFLNVICKRE